MNEYPITTITRVMTTSPDLVKHVPIKFSTDASYPFVDCVIKSSFRAIIYRSVTN